MEDAYKAIRKVKTFRQLLVWEKGMKLAKQTYQLTKGYPKPETYGLTNQLRRASVSISSNIAEGWGRNSTKSFIYFLQVAKGSVFETESLYLLSHELGYLEKNDLKEPLQKTQEITKMLNSMIRKLKSKTT